MKASIPWRYLSPRRGYHRELKVARACPEIKHLIDKAAFYKLCERITMLPLAVVFVIVVPLVYVVDLGRRILKNLPRLLPDFSNRRRRVIDEIYTIVPFEEMMKRAGLETRPRSDDGKDGEMADV